MRSHEDKIQRTIRQRHADLTHRGEGRCRRSGPTDRRQETSKCCACLHDTPSIYYYSASLWQSRSPETPYRLSFLRSSYPLQSPPAVSSISQSLAILNPRQPRRKPSQTSNPPSSTHLAYPHLHHLFSAVAMPPRLLSSLNGTPLILQRLICGLSASTAMAAKPARYHAQWKSPAPK